MDRLIQESGVGRASFYRHFSSKDALVVAVLESRDRWWRTTLAEAMATRGNEPIAIFDVVAERYAADDFRGCAFINAMGKWPTATAKRTAWHAATSGR